MDESVSISARIDAADRGGRAAAARALSDQVEPFEPGGGHGRPEAEGGGGRQGRTLSANCREVAQLDHFLNEKAMKKCN